MLQFLKTDLHVFDKIKMSTDCFEKDPMLILGKSLFSLLFHSSFSCSGIKNRLSLDSFLLLLYNVLCSNYFDVDLSAGIFRVCGGWGGAHVPT